ncbi:MAG: GspE/PulE family protein, partial [Pirellulales bacterium]|nr:GspE/PulE family protein [Pirellulales bacterium]
MSTLEAVVASATETLEHIDVDAVKLDPVVSHCLPAWGVRRQRALALCRIGEQTVVATSNTDLASVEKFVASHLSGPFRLVIAKEAALRRLISRIYAPRVAPTQAETEGDSGEIVESCDQLLRAAMMRGASDIHLVPEESVLRASFRVNGDLELFQTYPREMQAGLTSRIKVLAGLNIAEKREPQDGRFSWRGVSGQEKVDVRAATIPTRFGERVTLRLLMPLEALSSLAGLGMGPQELSTFTNAIDCAHGLVLLTGPTGCGKSTTLYTAIRQLMKTRGGNIITVEDPVEYEIPGTSQIEVDSAEKVCFARALRSVLRHDPDVIMLGEIRDAETAELAIKASLTGHLVFSTLHTNTAAGVVTRLIDMGVAPFLIAAT